MKGKEPVMDELVEEMNTALSGRLIVGNHDILNMFGRKAQDRLSGCSKILANLFIEGNRDLRENISDVIESLHKISENACIPDKKSHFSGRKNKTYKNDCQNTFRYIQKMELCLKLQQVGIIEEMSVLRQVKNTVKECETELSQCMDYGTEFLNQTINDIQVDRNDALRTWTERLKQRLLVLETSQILALQTLKQLDMLQDNDTMLLNKIKVMLFEAVPLWKEQSKIMETLQSANDALEKNLSEILLLEGKKETLKENINNIV